MNNVKLLENTQRASRIDLVKMLVSVQNVLDSYAEVHDRMNRLPISARLFLEENGGKIESLNGYKQIICNEMGMPEYQPST